MGFFSLKKRRTFCRSVVVAFWHLKGDYKQEVDWLFTLSDSDGTKGNGFKLKEGQFRLDVSKKLFTMKLVRHWNMLLEEVDSPSLERSTPGWTGHWDLKVTLPMTGVGGGGGIRTIQPLRSYPTQNLLWWSWSNLFCWGLWRYFPWLYFLLEDPGYSLRISLSPITFALLLLSHCSTSKIPPVLLYIGLCYSCLYLGCIYE